MTAADGLRIREAVRAVLISPDQQVLLVRFEFPTGTRWALPGGGIDTGETPEQALRRELGEEVGYRDAVVGPHLWNRLHIIPFFNGRFDGQRERIHLVEVDAPFEPHPALTWPQLNAEFVFELRWWTLAEIAASDHVHFAPRELATHLRTLVEQGPPAEPFDVAV